VQLPGRWDRLLRNLIMPQSTSAFFGMSAQNTMTAATMSLAVNENIGPMNSGEPVSASTIR